jgi:hypothetical protein
MRVHRPKPYVCIECDFEDHVRFLNCRDLDLAAGVWLRCLAHSRRQELDGVVPRSFLRRACPGKRFKRVDELVRVGLLRLREDGDYEIHAYAPRNQTRAMLAEERGNARERMRAIRSLRAQDGPTDEEDVRANKRVTNTLVPTSTSISTSTSLLNNLTDLDQLTEIQSSKEGRVQRGEDRPPPAEPAPVGQPAGAHPERPPLPVSEKAISGNYWLAAFTEGISAVTKRPCTAGRLYLGTLERIVAHHAPFRDAPRACAWLREEAKAFAGKWAGDDKHPPKGLTPDGLERWLNEGRKGPPEFGPKRIVQLPADQWTFDDDELESLGAKVLR